MCEAARKAPPEQPKGLPGGLSAVYVIIYLKGRTAALTAGAARAP